VTILTMLMLPLLWWCSGEGDGGFELNLDSRSGQTEAAVAMTHLLWLPTIYWNKNSAFVVSCG